MHLTNFSLNKKSKRFIKGPLGTKRSLAATMEHLADCGVNVDQVWTDIVKLCVKTILAVQPQLSASYKKYVPRDSVLGTSSCSCFEIFGFDIMLDDRAAPWLIEINHAPSFKGGSKAETACKRGVIGGAFELLGVSEKRKRTLTTRVRKQWAAFMWEQARAKSQEKQSAAARVAAAEAERKDWGKGGPKGAKKKSPQRRTLPPLSGGDSREDFAVRRSANGRAGEGARGGAAGDPWRIASRDKLAPRVTATTPEQRGEAGPGRAGGAGSSAARGRAGVSPAAAALLGGGGGEEDGGTSTSSTPLPWGRDGMGGYLSSGEETDDSDVGSVDGEAGDEEQEGLDVEDDGEEVVESMERLMLQGPRVTTVAQSSDDTASSSASSSPAPSSESPTSSESSLSSSSSGTSSASSGASAASSSASSSASSAASSASSSTWKTEEERWKSHRHTPQLAGGQPNEEDQGEEEAEDEEEESDEEEDEDGAKPAAYDGSNYWYEAPTGDGPHGYIRIYSEVSANDRAHYADVIKAAQKIFDRSAEEEREKEELEKAEAAMEDQLFAASPEGGKTSKASKAGRPKKAPDLWRPHEWVPADSAKASRT